MNTLACHNVGKYDVRWWFTSPSYLNKFTINAMRASNSFYLKDFKYGIDSNRTLERLIKSPFAFTALLALAREYAPYQLSLIHISEPTRLGMISYAVFCLKKKKQKTKNTKK